MNAAHTAGSPGLGTATARHVLVLSLFVFGLLVSLWVPLTDGDDVEDPATFLEAIAGLKPVLTPGTTVLIQPPWRDDVLDALDARAAAGRPVLPARVDATVALAHAHGTWPGRVVLVADARQPLPRSLRRRLADADVTRTGGLLTAVLDDAPAASDASTLDELLAGARVQVTSGNKKVDCRFNPSRRRFICPGMPDWIWVGDYTMNSGGARKSCLWAHPTKDGAVRITFPKVTLKDALVVEHALADGAVRNGGAPVEVAVRVDGRALGRSVRTNGPGFAHKRFVTDAGAVADVELEISAKDDGARHHCVTARLVEEAP